MALATNREAHQARAIRVQEVEQFAGESPRIVAWRGYGEVAEWRFGPAFLAGEEPRVAGQERARAVDLQAPYRLLPEAGLEQDHVASAVQAVPRPDHRDVPRFHEPGHC